MKPYTILNTIHAPEDLKRLSAAQLERLCGEIRRMLIQTVSQTGGHLASNLGAVELTVMLHKIFESPKDQIIWDVGHQCYTHKILTGRKEQFGTLRQEGGLSGFTKSAESIHDPFVSGHASTSISIADGLAKAKNLLKEDGHVIAVIGDGAFTGGLAFEGMNNIIRDNSRVIVILNDNKMSIGKNVGSLTGYLSKLRTHHAYFRVKDTTKTVLGAIPVVGESLVESVSMSKSFLKQAVYRTSFFEDLGFVHIGPVDGHNLAMLEDALHRAKSLKRPVLIHVETTKGKGYALAEKNPGAFHAVAPFDPAKGPANPTGTNFSIEFGKELTRIAVNEPRICAVTAAMKYATGLNYFAARFKSHGRFFDVGIAEAHGMTFTAALASKGLIPVFAVYSSFLQRAYDQIIHDCSIEKKHVVLAVDRAGIVGDDGETHQGVFDCAFLSAVPGATIYSPATYEELRYSMAKALLEENGLCAVRYPRGTQPQLPAWALAESKDWFYQPADDKKMLIISYGRIYAEACKAAGLLEQQGIQTAQLKLTKVYPLPESVVATAMEYENVLFVEEGIQRGGIAEHFGAELLVNGFKGRYAIRAVPNQFIPQGKVDSVLQKLGLDGQSIADVASSMCHKERKALD